MDRLSTPVPSSFAQPIQPPRPAGGGSPRATQGSPCNAATIVDVIDATGTLAAAEIAYLTQRLVAAVGVLGSPGVVRIRIVGDEEMAGAHAQYSHVEGTTDVLTFDLAASDEELDVDLLLCADEARRQATGRGHPLEQELLLYALHGVLHCQGFDDHTDDDSSAMHAREDEILAAIGVGATYSRDERPAGRGAKAGA